MAARKKPKAVFAATSAEPFEDDDTTIESKVSKRRLTLPRIENVYVSEWGGVRSDAAQKVMADLNVEQAKARSLLADAEEAKDAHLAAAWRCAQVAMLQHAQTARALYNVLLTLESPAVAHAVDVKYTLDRLASKIEELERDLSSHERNNEHTYRGY